MSVALGLKACTLGYHILFKNATALSTELYETRDNYHLSKKDNK